MLIRAQVLVQLETFGRTCEITKFNYEMISPFANQKPEMAFKKKTTPCLKNTSNIFRNSRDFLPSFIKYFFEHITSSLSATGWHMPFTITYLILQFCSIRNMSVQPSMQF